MTGRVVVTVADGVAEVRLNRPDKMNALDPGMFDGLLAAAERLGGDASLRAVVLHGEGRAFCAGLDMASFAAMGGGNGIKGLAPRTHGIANRFQYAAWAWRELPVPVIAAVHGIAYGGGLQIALGADMRYAAPGTKFSVMEIKWGLVPDMAGTQVLRHLMRDDVIRDLTFTGRVVEADEALSLGLVTRVIDDPLAAARAAAAEIAGKSPDAMRAAKRLLNRASVIEPGAGLLAESVEQDVLIGSPNQLEAVAANLEKRRPSFRDPA
jgi:enoyl-CoA hydratase/carnithine racemase